jgi:hypothetical protein
MASLFLTTTARDTPWYPWAHSNYVRLMKSAERSPAGEHTLADHPNGADIVLFVEPGRRFQTDIVRSAMYRRYRQKSLVFDFSDQPLPRLPGLYVGLNARQAKDARFRAGFYLRVADNALFDRVGQAVSQPDLLFSFVGRAANCAPVRGRVLQLRHPRAQLQDSSTQQSDNDPAYITTLSRSKFVLAPKGYSTSSWRLFETMRAGRVPVIISDEWEAPQGLSWPEFSLRVAEKDIETIPQLLESLEARAPAMGALAREQWDRCFALESCFQWVAGQCAEILEGPQRTDASGGLHFFMKAVAAGGAPQYLRELLATAARSGQ